MKEGGNKVSAVTEKNGKPKEGKLADRGSEIFDRRGGGECAFRVEKKQVSHK